MWTEPETPSAHCNSVLEYRAYLLDSDDHIMRGVDLVCEDDEAATTEAKQLADGHDVELWQGARLVATFRRLAGP
jgi:hypothetical protein